MVSLGPPTGWTPAPAATLGPAATPGHPAAPAPATKTGSGWYTVKFEFGGVDNFRADELRVL